MLDVFETGFLRPTIPPLIPSVLTRVGPDRRKAFVLYDKMTHSDWVDWWLQTDFGRESKINWDSTRHTEIWEQFDQVAHGVDGAPKVMCRRCGAILEHPYIVNPKSKGKKIQYHGTSTMTRHVTTNACLKSEEGKKAQITRFLKKGVRYYLLLYHSTNILYL
jgi:hypothetical protein